MRFVLPHSMQSKCVRPAGMFNAEGGRTWLHDQALPRHHACKWALPYHTACGRTLPQPRACTRTSSSHNSRCLTLAHLPTCKQALPHHMALGRRCPINGHASGLCPNTRDVSRISPRIKHAVELWRTSRHATDSAPPLATWVDFAQPDTHADGRCPSGLCRTTWLVASRHHNAAAFQPAFPYLKVVAPPTVMHGDLAPLLDLAIAHFRGS